MSKKETQKLSKLQLIFAHLRKGRSITPLSAWEKYGCYRLSSVINRLRKKGHEITTTMKKQGENNFAVYRLVK